MNLQNYYKTGQFGRGLRRKKKYKKDEVKIKNAVLYKAPVGLFTGLENSF
jgi:hypothetical protein